MCIEVTNDKYRHTQNFYSEVFDLETISEDSSLESNFSNGYTDLEVESISPSTDIEIPHTDLLEVTEAQMLEIWNKNEFTGDLCQNLYEYGDVTSCSYIDGQEMANCEKSRSISYESFNEH